MEVGGRSHFGGMEKAFSTKIMARLDEFFAGRMRINIFGKALQKTEQRRKRKRTCRRQVNGVWGLWELLPKDLLVSIILKLNIIDYFAFSGVCRSWRHAAIDFRKYFMERQQPLVVVRPKNTKRACILYNMFDGKQYKAMLPNLCCRPFVGLSSGYLITIDKNIGFWLVNLMTRHELHFPVLPGNLSYIDECSIRPVLFQSTRLSKVFMVIFFKKRNWLLLSETGASSWQVHLLPRTSAGISDVKIFDGKIFVLTCDALMGKFNPRVDPVLQLYSTKIRFEIPSNMSLQLVTSDNRLCVAISHCPMIFSWYHYLLICELDHKKMEMVKQVHAMGSKSLFLSRYNATVVDTTGWGAGNCVCSLEAHFRNRFAFFNLTGNRLATGPVVWDAPRWEPYFWYFPNESCDISCVDDEFDMYRDQVYF